MTEAPAKEAYEKMSEPLRYAFIDVRSNGEFKHGHAQGFENIPIEDIVGNPAVLPKKEIFFMCASGGRSARATRIAQENGISARNVEGGFFAWKKEGLPVE